MAQRGPLVILCRRKDLYLHHLQVDLKSSPKCPRRVPVVSLSTVYHSAVIIVHSKPNHKPSPACSRRVSFVCFFPYCYLASCCVTSLILFYILSWQFWVLFMRKLVVKQTSLLAYPLISDHRIKTFSLATLILVGLHLAALVV